MSTRVETQRRHALSGTRKRWRSLAPLGLALLVFAGGLVWAIGVIRPLQALRANLAELQAIAAQPSGDLSLPRLSQLASEAHSNSVALRSAAGPILVVAPHLGWVPVYGGDLVAAPALLDLSVELTAAAATGLEGLKPLETFVDGGLFSGGSQATLAALAEARPELEETRRHIQLALAAREAIDAQRLSPRMAQLMGQLDQALSWFSLGVDGALVLPELAGLDGPRNYLVLVQNEDEIRPTGGFISAAGLIRVERGTITSQSFEDSYAVDDLMAHAYPEPPAPLLTYMRSELWLFRDSNWSPDFPMAARQAAEFYRMGHGIEPDGVIAIDQRATQLIVGALGPLPPLPGESEPITGESLIQTMRESRSQGSAWWWKRKEFITQIAEALYSRVQGGLSRADFMKLAAALREALDERHILVYLREPDAAALLAARGWDGALRSSEGDYLMVVDANLGFNKANAVVEQTIRYDVDLKDPAQPQAELQTLYWHRGQVHERPCDMHLPLSLEYELMVARCYWDYVRVLAPEGSRLLWSTRHPVPGEQLISGQASSGETETLTEAAGGGKVVFGKFLVVSVGGSTDSRFQYALPPTVVQRGADQMRYRLLVQKQPGTVALPLTVIVQLRPDATVITTTPEPTAVEGDRLRFELTLRTDQTVEVVFR